MQTVRRYLLVLKHSFEKLEYIISNCTYGKIPSKLADESEYFQDMFFSNICVMTVGYLKTVMLSFESVI